MGDDEVTFSVKHTGKLSALRSSKLHHLTVKTSFKGHSLEMEDVNFHFDSAVLMPDFGPFAPKTGTEEQNRITGLAVLYACYKHAQEDKEKKADKPDEERQKLLIAGHTDRKGSSTYNQELSNLRADNILRALKGDREGWVTVSLKKHKVEDYQQILKWVAWNFDWDCDPGEVNNKDNQQTRDATKKFQHRYNSETGSTIQENGIVGKETWGAFFDMYMRELKSIMGVDDTGLAAARDAVLVLDEKRPVVGCGENFPKSEAPHDCKNLKKSSSKDTSNAIDRRVELMFFDPDEIPELQCHTKPGACEPTKCDLYCGSTYSFDPIPLKPIPKPSKIAAQVFLKLEYRDPEFTDASKTTHPFPETLPVQVVFPDGSTPLDLRVEKDGKLTFQVDRDKKSFTLRFDTNDPEFRYFVSPTGETTGDKSERCLKEDKALEALADHCRVFQVPNIWGLKESEWTVENTTKYSHPDFTGIEGNQENIGSEATRALLRLDPHWKHFQITYFDRRIRQRMGLPPIVVEGMQSATSTQPDTRAAWVSAGACQCIPWILKKPDNQSVLQFRTAPDTYVHATGTGTTRELVTKPKGGGSVTPTLRINAGKAVNIDFSVPNTERLGYYDLPPVWKSKQYFGKLSGGKDGSGKDLPPAKQGLLDSLMSETTTDEKPLMASLDDMILTDENLKPLAWMPDDKTENRIALFCNTFSKAGPGSADLNVVGLYKADTGNKRSYFTVVPTVEKTRNYIADYPDWTRLVVMNGNLFDVFDRRVDLGPNGVVGARAAVRWADITHFKSPGEKLKNDRPSLVKKSPFFMTQPFHYQDHEFYDKIGRFDVSLVRCCDIDTDNATELGVCLSTFRFFFNFDPKFKADNNPKAKPHAIPAADQRAWIDTAITNLLKRWNDYDVASDKTIVNSGKALVESTDAGTKLKARSIWFAQHLPVKICHYELGVFEEKDKNGKDVVVRAYMASKEGNGVLDKTNNAPESDGWFTFAHETGHGASLVDEYIEHTSPLDLPGPRLPGFDSNSAGSPFVDNTLSIMNHNKRVQARHYWHYAEWIRHLLANKVEFRINLENRSGSTSGAPYLYTLPHAIGTPTVTYIGWPLKQEKDKERDPHGKFDVFFTPLGDDFFSRQYIPTRSKATGTFDGIITVVVKMKFSFDENDKAKKHDWLKKAQARVDTRFNYRYAAAGKVRGIDFKQCLLHFSPRYRVGGYSEDSPSDTNQHIKVDVPDKGKAEWDSGIFSSKHKVFIPFGQVNVFDRFFGHMVGLPDGAAMDDPKSYVGIISGVMQNAVVQKTKP